MRLTQFLCSRYFKRYIDRELHKGRSRKMFHPLLGWKIAQKKAFYPNEYRPWTYQYLSANPLMRPQNPPLFVEPVTDWTIFKGDRVEILVGPDAGKQGIVNSVIKERNWCWVDGLNNEYNMQQLSDDTPAACVRNEQPLLVTNQVKLVDPSSEKSTDIEWRYTEEGEKVRVSMETGRIIPLPEGAYMDDDLVIPSAYQDCDKDTKEKEIKAVTFKPKLCTFEEDIMESEGIVETRKPAETFWY